MYIYIYTGLARGGFNPKRVTPEVGFTPEVDYSRATCEQKRSQSWRQRWDHPSAMCGSVSDVQTRYRELEANCCCGAGVW